MKENYTLFRTGFLYVFLLSANTFCIAKLYWIGIAVFGFLISFLWTVNVKKITASTLKNRLYYAIGAMFGGLCGVALINMFKNLLR